jgi:hypothetical protein
MSKHAHSNTDPIGHDPDSGALTYTTGDGQTWYLHVLEEEHDKTGTPYEIYYFAKEPGENATGQLPDSYHIKESQTGMPVTEED